MGTAGDAKFELQGHAGHVKYELRKGCRALALSLIQCLDESECIQVEKRSYKDCALDKHLKVSPACRDIRGNYLKCKHDQVYPVVQERINNNPELLMTVTRDPIVDPIV